MVTTFRTPAVLAASFCVMAFSPQQPGATTERHKERRVPEAVACTLNGSGTFADKANPNQGLTSLTPRTVDVTASSEGSCQDLRPDKSATGGHSIVKRSVTATGSMTNSTCVLANGNLTIDVTWTLDDNSTVKGSNTLTIANGNFLKPVPGTGKGVSGLLSGVSIQTNMVMTDVAADTAACNSTEGLKKYSYTIQVDVLQS
ncbi:hypothetical protein ACFP1Z_05985 [Streptomyces gamaensis]|uniref:Ig-like domain-containing protein n=1 Tax=Streptomyces gamaensis TaxID=1763542 RepID=A0ABW0YT41_9ACTN